MISNKMTSVLTIIVSLVVFTVTAYADNETAYWTDTQNKRISAIELETYSNKTVRLNVEIPKNTTLKAYSAILYYDNENLTAKVKGSPDSKMNPLNINDNEGSVVFNSFDVSGISGKVSLADVTFSGINASQSHCSVLFTAFGKSTEEQFLPKTSVLKITVK
jgi:hypothetical protein